ncbi:MAG: leucine-rich repeat domain-containing protein [Oscillospiraceae bacterium]|jgi:hypothetical protein|nr:leucine-rich repeat domain-containing protein [Oscillospiraceae bacterium]
MEKKNLVSKKNVLFFSVFLMCISAFCCLLVNNKVFAINGEDCPFKYEFAYIDNEKSAIITGIKENAKIEENLIIPNEIDEIPVKIIGKGAFEIIQDTNDEIYNDIFFDNEVYKIKTVVLPKTICKIDNEAFKQCHNLEKINLEFCNYIGDKAFEKCEKLKEINLSNCVFIGDSAFIFCIELAKTQFNESCLLKINKKAFAYCISLKETNLNACNNKIILEEEVFFHCVDLTLTFLNKPNFLKTIETFYFLTKDNKISVAGDNCPFKYEVTTYFDNEESVIIRGLKENIYTSENLIIPDEIDGIPVKIIGEGAFKVDQYKNNQEEVYKIKTVVLPKTIWIIDDGAFEQCHNLEKINLEFCDCIGDKAFQKCIKLKEINLYNCVFIGDSAFNLCASLVKTQFGSRLEKISKNAFAYCTSLNVINLSMCNNITILEEGVFHRCQNLIFFATPESLKVIEKRAFSCCINLKALGSTTYNSLKIMENICEKAFTTFCINLSKPGSSVTKALESSSFVFPENIWKIDDEAFEQCHNFEKINLEFCIYIGDEAFKGCRRLKEINLYNCVFIGDSAFNMCASLVKIQFGCHIQQIGENIFANCKSLKQINVLEESTWL